MGFIGQRRSLASNRIATQNFIGMMAGQQFPFVACRDGERSQFFAPPRGGRVSNQRRIEAVHG